MLNSLSSSSSSIIISVLIILSITFLIHIGHCRHASMRDDAITLLLSVVYLFFFWLLVHAAMALAAV